MIRIQDSSSKRREFKRLLDNDPVYRQFVKRRLLDRCYLPFVTRC
jgi:hypothetical protein